uniref:Polyprotein n=1 Tax=Barley mild mosaic virus TaxID=12466 RepID=Q68VH8_9POTY|nr:polyprotein [Barley mild mosaic virus]
MEEFIPEVFYQNQVQSLKKILKSWKRDTSIYAYLAREQEVLAFLVLSPAHIAKLNKLLTEESARCALLAQNCETIEALAVVRQALQGVTLHFGGNGMEKGWLHMMKALDACLDESFSENAAALKKSIQAVGHRLIAAKNRIEGCERSVNHLTTFQFAREYGLSTTYFEKLSNIGGHIRSFVWSSDSGEIFPKLKRSSRTRRISTFTSYYWGEFWCNCIWFLCCCWSPARWCFNSAIFIWSLCGVLNLSMIVLQFALKRHFGRYYFRYIMSGVLAICAVCCVHLKNRKGPILQASQKDKRFIGILAFCITVIYMFDVDLADALSNNLHKISRLVNLFLDDNRGFATPALDNLTDFTTILQSGTSSDDLKIVQDTLAVVLQVDDEDATQDDAIYDSDGLQTFKQWVSHNQLAGMQLARPLQYPCSNTYGLTADNVAELSASMAQEAKQWSQVVGHTGSGKSTRLPTAYANCLKGLAGRKKNVLVCEPTRAATVNVTSGISQNFGRLVYGRHEGWNNLGDKTIQVMTYGSALAAWKVDNKFLSQFDAVFLDESHPITTHALVFESICQEVTNIRKFYVSATPRDGKKCPEAVRRYEIKTVKSECSSVDTFVRSQEKTNSLYVLDHDTVLVFLAGKAECDRAASNWNKLYSTNMYAYSLTDDNFTMAYEKIVTEMLTKRTIVFCTNILETGVTLNVDCVVDFGFTMRPELDLVDKSLTLMRRRVTENERAQRIGRAGRLRTGHAICIGNPKTRHDLVPPETLYEAALLSFVHGVQFYINEHFENAWIEGVTKAQASVMTQFKLSPFLMRDIVRDDGAIPLSLHKILKDYTHRNTDLIGTKLSVMSHVYNSWPLYRTVHQSIFRGDSNVPQTLRYARVPFNVSTAHDFPWEDFAQACLEFQPRVLQVFSDSSSTSRIINLQIGKMHIVNSMEEVKININSYQRSAENLRSVKDSFESSIFRTKLLRGNPTGKITKRIETLLDNVRVLQQIHAKLEMIAYSGGEKINMDKKSVDELNEIVELQSKNSLTAEELARILHLTEPTSTFFNLFAERGRQMLVTLLVMVAASLMYLVFWVSPRKQDDITIEGKGRAYNRDKRMGYDSYEEDEVRNKISKKFKERSTRFSNDSKPETSSKYRNLKQEFVNFYDLKTDANVIQAVFTAMDGAVLLQTENPMADIGHVNRLLQDHFEDSESQAVHEGLNTMVKCRLTMKDGRQFELDMEHHDPETLAKLGGEVGFRMNRDDLRQVGATRYINPRAQTSAATLEGMTMKPMSSFTIDSAKMVGFIKTAKDTLNCILYGDWIIAPAHIQQGEGDITFIFQHVQFTTTTERLASYGIRQFKGLDLVVIRRPQQIRAVKKDMRASILDTPTEIQMLYLSTKGGKYQVSTSAVCFPHYNNRWGHVISTAEGMCGCIVFNPTTNHIVGIHVSYNDTRRRNEFQAFTSDVLTTINAPGHEIPFSPWIFDWKFCGYTTKPRNMQSAPSTLERLNINATGFGFKLDAQEIKPAMLRSTESFSREFPDTQFKLIGEVKKGLIDKHTITGENPYFLEFLNTFKPYQWVQAFMDEYAPSILAYDAYFKDLKKYDRPPHANVFCQDTLTKAKHKMISILEEAGMGRTLVRTTEQVLLDMAWTTSGGPLYHGKKIDIVQHLSDDELVQFSEACQQALITGTLDGVWNGSLKAELRSSQKILERKTRVFTAAPITSLIAMKYYVDDFNKQFYKTHLKAPHTVGINKFNRGWQNLYEKLNKPGWTHGSGDGSRFDSSIDGFLFDVIKDIRKHFMHTEHHKELDTIYEEIVNTKICLANGLVIQKNCGNNSGQPSTVVDNTLALMTAFLYAYARLTGDHAFELMDENFVFVCNGDDNKFSMSPSFMAKFGCDFSPFLSELGLTYEFDEATEDICENPYMSLTMVRTSSGIGFSLSIERIVAILQWSRAGGVLHAYLSGIAALFESFNTPKLFNLVHTYLLWLVTEHEEELFSMMELKDMFMPLPTREQIALLHYVGTEPIVEETFLQAGHEEPDPIVPPVPDTDLTNMAAAPPDNRRSRAVIPRGTSDWSLPEPKMRTLGFKSKINIETLANVPDGYMNTFASVATESQRRRWEEAARGDFGITDDEKWEKLLIAACIYFADNGTSPNFDEELTMEVNGGLNSIKEYPVRPFVVRAKKISTLRRIFRCYSIETKLMFVKLRRVPHWAIKHGCLDEIVFDFMIPDQFTSRTALETLKQTKLAAIGVGTSNSLLTSEQTNMRTTETRRRNDYDGHEALLR